MPPRPQASRPPRGKLCSRRCPPVSPEDDPADLTHGWQRPASRTVDEFCHRAISRELDAPSLAMLDSQSGSHAASVFTTRPVSPELSLSSPLFRVLLLRQLRLPLPLTSARCRCRQLHDLFGDHLAACPRSGVERAAARICREAGATVALNVRLRDLNVDVARQDERRIEVIANGLALWGGSQLAVGTTLVSPLTSAGAPHRAAGTGTCRGKRACCHRLALRTRLGGLGLQCAERSPPTQRTGPPGLGISLFFAPRAPKPLPVLR